MKSNRNQTHPEGMHAGTMPWLMHHIAEGKFRPHAEMTSIDPEIAAFLLTRNPDNRRILKGKVKSYAEHLRSGTWSLNGETIIISSDGWLNDGQNRLTAVVETGLAMQTFIAFGVARDSRKTVDVGAVKSAASFLGMDGLPHPDIRAAIARLLLAYEGSNGANIARKNSFDAIECYDRAAEDDAIGGAAAFSAKYYKSYRKFVAPAIMGLCHYLLGHTGHDGAVAFLTQVALGEDLARGDVAYAVRERLLILGNVRHPEKLEIMLRGWVAYRAGEKRAHLKLMGGDLPDLGVL